MASFIMTLLSRQRWDNSKESLGQPLSAGGRDCSRKDTRRKMQAVIWGLTFLKVFFWKRFSFLLRIQIFFFSSCSVLLLRQNTANTFHFLSCLVGCWGDVISELVYVSAGPYLQQNLWYMPVPPVADWIWPGKWRKPQLAELQKMNFT